MSAEPTGGRGGLPFRSCLSRRPSRSVAPGRVRSPRPDGCGRAGDSLAPALPRCSPRSSVLLRATSLTARAARPSAGLGHAPCQLGSGGAGPRHRRIRTEENGGPRRTTEGTGPGAEPATLEVERQGYRDPKPVGPSGIAPSAVAANAAAPPAVGPNAVAPSAASPNAIAPPAVVPNAIAPPAVDPNAVTPITIALIRWDHCSSLIRREARLVDVSGAPAAELPS
jgi:hypothetical protein